MSKRQYISTQHDVPAPPAAIVEAPFQGGRGPCDRSDRTAPDLDTRNLTGRTCPSGECARQMATALVHRIPAGFVE